MNRTHILLAAFVLATACGRAEERAEDHDPAEAEAFARGPHNGRLLEQGDFAVELAIHEAGIPPEYRVWLYADDEPLPPTPSPGRSYTLVDATKNGAGRK